MTANLVVLYYMLVIILAVWLFYVILSPWAFLVLLGLGVRYHENPKGGKS
jgi:hypothetical protein